MENNTEKTGKIQDFVQKTYYVNPLTERQKKRFKELFGDKKYLTSHPFQTKKTYGIRIFGLDQLLKDMFCND